MILHLHQRWLPFPSLDFIPMIPACILPTFPNFHTVCCMLWMHLLMCPSSASRPTYGLCPRPLRPVDRLGLPSVGADVLEPTSYCDVFHTKWQLMMAKETVALESIGTSDIVYVPPRVRPITWWVYKVRTHSDGSLELYKARLVGHGFQQEHGPNYDETFAPGNCMTTVRTPLIVAFVRHWFVSRLDVKNAFLNGELREGVYIHPPLGILHLTTCFVIFITLYGFKQAPRAWFEHFASMLVAASFQRVLMIRCCLSSFLLLVRLFFYMLMT
ncbi:hypothetical protein ACQJBY_007730 [Aegilops geniculata]